MSNRVSFIGFQNAPIIVTSENVDERNTGPVSAEFKFRPFEGIGNNLTNPWWGHSHIPLLRKAPSAYDPTAQLSLHNNPNARIISNNICKGTSPPSPNHLSNMTWVWGQFIDHELDLTEPQTGDAKEVMVVPVPDTATDPEEIHAYPGRNIFVTRSNYIGTPTDREQTNIIPCFMDASNVYGSTPDIASKLRRLDGTGKLKTSMADNGEDLLPYNTEGLGMATNHGQDPADMFMAGDVRANENVALIGMHTIWVREHNRLCDVLIKRYPKWTGMDEMLFQHARRYIVGLHQNITFEEYLSKLLGPIPAYAGYNPGVNASIATEFSTVAYRVGHTMLSDTLQIGLNPANTLGLFDAFFKPEWVQANGVDAVLQGQAVTIMRAIDAKVVESVRSQLFGPPTTTTMMDLIALNIMRARDHGIPGYNAVRVAYGLKAIQSWAEFPTSQENRDKLAALYSSPDVVDPWIGCVVETRMEGKEVGPLLFTILLDQALRTRSGDRFWFENDEALSLQEKIEIRNTKLADVLDRNTAPGITFPRDVFRVTPL